MWHVCVDLRYMLVLFGDKTDGAQEISKVRWAVNTVGFDSVEEVEATGRQPGFADKGASA